MLLRVAINDAVEIVRDLPWDRIVQIKEQLKKLGFKWTGECWRGRVLSPSTVLKLRELLDLRPSEIRRILETCLVNAEGGVVGVDVVDKSLLPEEIQECIVEEVDTVKVVSVPCFVRNFIRRDTKYLAKATSFEDYIEQGLREFRKSVEKFLIVGNLERALESTKEYLLSSSKTREIYQRRLEWWTARLHENYVEVNFLKRGLLRELMAQLRIRYNKVEPDGTVRELMLPVIKRENIVKVDDHRWRIYFPQFFKERVAEILRHAGYRVEEVEYVPKKLRGISDKVSLYPFQEEALQRWLANKHRGTIVIPTGGGKTFIALKAMAQLQVRTLVLVITEELLEQWAHRIESFLGYRPGRLSGKYDELREITVCTYHTAVKDIDRLRDRFDLVIADECHHVPAETFKQVLFQLSAPYRMALSATVERSDGNEHLIFLACGEVVYRVSYRDLVKHGLVVPVRHFRIYVDLSDDEKRLYEKKTNILELKSIACRARAKIDVAVRIARTEYELGSKILIFTQYKSQAEELYRRLREEIGKVALITGSTRNRETLFRMFSKGAIRVIVTTTVLDEGVDVPDADTAIIVSGTGSSRQMIQRIGRVVRAAPGKKEARVYELVTRRTVEEALSENRHPKKEIEEIECRRVLARELEKLLRHIHKLASSSAQVREDYKRIV